MHAIAKFAVMGAVLGGLTIAGAGTAAAAVPHTEAPRSIAMSTDELGHLQMPWHGQLLALDDDWDDDRDDDWDDDGLDDDWDDEDWDDD